MRKIRSSGSVEGVMGNHDSYSDTGKLMEGVLAAFAQFDNDVRSERTRAGMRAALELGRWTFPAPLGYLNAAKWSGKSLIPDPERAPLVREMFEECASGRFTKQEVLARITERGLRTRRGLALSPQSFGQMLRNSIYIGGIDCPEYGVLTRGDFDPLVSEQTFYRAQAVSEGRVRVTAPHTFVASLTSAAISGCSIASTGSSAGSRRK